MGYPRLLAVILVTTSAMSFADTVSAQSKSQGKGRKPQQVVPTGAEDSPLAPVVDPAAELLLEQMTSRSDAGLVVITRPDGTESVDLEGRFRNVMLAAPSIDAGHAAACLTGAAAATHLQNRPSSATAVPAANYRSVKRPSIRPATLSPALVAAPISRPLEEK
jgi:hypothetical protein